MSPVLNAMTVDVEDYFQVSAFDALVSRAEWDHFESRVCRNTERLLDLFGATDTKATFFMLGWVAERFPGLVRRIHDAGHELASHGYGHGLVYDETPESFRADLRRASAAIQDAAGVAVRGYRAPSFSVVDRSLWALDVLVSEGYHYDSSIYPIRHDRYGIPGWHRHIHRVTREDGALWELPGSTICRFGANLPIGGGGYFRLLPYGWTRSGFHRLNEMERRPGIFYIHPWEIDPEQPRIKAGTISRWRHYHNLDKTEARLKRLLSEFRFGRVSDVLTAHQLQAVA
jgi:polysaccharide deacetylase family protein (PEP-CTERM system associated)